MITIVETTQFIKKAEKLLKNAAERKALIDYVARYYKNGDVITKTGGVRKLRYAREGQGKSGSYRVIYYYYNDNNPLILFTLFGKNEKVNISDAEKNALHKIIQLYKKEMKT